MTAEQGSAALTCSRCGLCVVVHEDEAMCGCTVEAVRQQHGDQAADDLRKVLYD